MSRKGKVFKRSPAELGKRRFRPGNPGETWVMTPLTSMDSNLDKSANPLNKKAFTCMFCESDKKRNEMKIMSRSLLGRV